MSALTDRALALLQDGPKTTAELARGMGCAHNTVWGILQPLRAEQQVTMSRMKYGHLRIAIYALADSRRDA